MENHIVTAVSIEFRNLLTISVHADEGVSDEIILETSIEGTDVRCTGNSYLEAYQKLRDRLLALGYGLKCCGSLINAVQSGMMAHTPKIYLVRYGCQALLKDIADIWEYCDIHEFPYTKEQNDFTEQWYESLRK